MQVGIFKFTVVEYTFYFTNSKHRERLFSYAKFTFDDLKQGIIPSNIKIQIFL